MMALRGTFLSRSVASTARVRPRRRPTFGRVEILEGRQLLTTFAVTSLADSGFGTLRQAILSANSNPGPDAIDFEVTGTIKVGPTSLPAITDAVDIDGSTAPGFAGSPVVTIDFAGTQGLHFAQGADASILKGLSLVRASNAGVTLDASHVAVQGNYIGVLPDGKTAAGNGGDGVQIDASSVGDLIGQSNPVTGVSYYNANSVSMQPVSGWQGIRNGATAGQYLITGTSSSHGLLYEGPISGVGGTSFSVDYPNATTTSVYGPDIVSGNVLRLVGTYKTGSGVVNGFLYQGTTAGLANSANYQTIDYPGAQYTYVHSTMGGLAVGNADGPEGNAPFGTGEAFIYDIAKGTFTNVVYPGATSTTAYGIWYNGGTSYTIAGGYTTPVGGGPALANGYMVDYDSSTGQFTHWASFSYPNGLLGQNFATHFEGISSDQKGVYTLAADSIQTGTTNLTQGSVVSVRRNPDGSFGVGTWTDLNFPGTTGLTSNNSVAGNQAVGIILSSSGTFSYQATVNVGFQLSNVIGGNGGNGVGIYGGSLNVVAMNNIGTDATGTIKLGNAQNGILITNGATRNVIGGEATGSNDPTASVFVRPPQGNLISGNGGDGVLITGGATLNLLSGNFVGTSASGNSALGNRQDGVGIIGADNNYLVGCTFQQDPFVFYNVLSGNGGNGLRITNSNNTTVQANFMGVGANNATIVGNGGDGLLVAGTSRNTQVGGVIPLGNVISGNAQNGIEVRDQASGFVSFNTFAGLYAFGAAAPNARDGILITSNGGNNTIRTSIVSGNFQNGIEIGGDASGVQVTETAVGTDTKIQAPLPNWGDGILITGSAHGNTIGGFQPSIEPQTTVSSNLGFGIQVTGSAHNNMVVHTYVGTSAVTNLALGNRLGGIDLGPGTYATLIGGAAAPLQDRIVYNGGHGVSIRESVGNSILGDQIQFNLGYGVVVLDGSNDQIGTASAGNLISGNGAGGLFATGLLAGTKVEANQISANGGDGVILPQARYLTVGPGNVISLNKGFGLIAYGPCGGTVVKYNVFAGNLAGSVNLKGSQGITHIP
jgi:hypothetical protein